MNRETSEREDFFEKCRVMLNERYAQENNIFGYNEERWQKYSRDIKILSELKAEEMVRCSNTYSARVSKWRDPLQ